MLKFLRKYQMWILVIGGAFLMVAFVAPQAVEQLFGQSRNPKVMEIDGEDIRMQEFRQTLSQYQTLEQGLPIITSILPFDQQGSRDTATHWYLLSYEAEKAGMVGRGLDGQAWLPDIARNVVVDAYRQNRQIQNLTPEILAEETDRLMVEIEGLIAGATGGNEANLQFFLESVSKARGITRLASTLSTAAKLSPERLRMDAANRLNSARVATLWIPAEKLASESDQTPSESELASFYERHREADPATSELGIGYLLQPRVKLEWITLDRTTIRDAIRVDPVEAAKFHQLNRERYTGEFSAERDAVNSALKDQKVEEIIAEASRVIGGEAKRAAISLPDDGDYKDLPADWAQQRPTLDALADLVVERITESMGVTIPRPEINVRSANWLQQTDIASLPGIGFANVRVASQNVPLRQAVFSLKELRGSTTLPLQVGLMASEYPAQTFDGSRHFFRVLDVRDVSPPDSMEEVRERVLNDYASVRAYERLAERANQLAATAGAEDLQALAEQLNTENDLSEDEALAVRAGIPLSRRQAGFSPGLQLPEVRDTIISLAEQLDPTVPAEDQSLSARVSAVAVPSQRGVVVTRIDQYVPLTQESLRAQLANIEADTKRAEISEQISEARGPLFGLNRLMARHDYKDLSRNSNDDSSASDDAVTEEDGDAPADGG